MAKRKKLTWGEIISAWAVVGAVVTGVGAAAIQTYGKSDPPANVNCPALVEDYRREVRTSPEMREIVLPGADGRSTLLNDPVAQYCRIQPADVDIPPQTHP